MSGTSQETIQVLHVDDEPDFADLTATFLERENDQFAVKTATRADEGLEMVADRPPDCIVSDFDMPGMDGIEFLETVRDDYAEVPFILFTGKGSEEVASDALRAGATDYIQKQSGSEQYELLANRIENAVEQSRSERRLREMREEYTTVFESTQNGLALVNTEDDEFHYQRCNPRAAELLGRDRSEIVGKSPHETLGPENAKKVTGAYRKCIDQREPVECFVTLDLPMGHVIRECLITPLISNGEVEQLVVAFQDITERRERQQELRRNERAMDEAPVGITITDPDQDDNPIIYANNRFRSLTGYADDEILGHNCRFLQGEDTSSDPIATMREAIDNEERVTVQLRNYRRDGTEFWNRVSIAPVRDDKESVVNFVGFQHDITDHKQQELELKRTRDLLDQTECIADVGGWEIDTETMEVFWTENLFDLLGVDYDEEPPLDEALAVYHEDDRPLVENAVETALDAGESFDVEARFHRPDGELGWLRVQGTPTTDDGSVVALRGAVQDITERKEYERRLEAQNERLEEFTSVVSHDLRSPLAVADGRLELIREECESPHIDDVAQALDRMDTLIDDLLTLAREGDQVGELEPVVLADLIEDCWQNLTAPDAEIVTTIDRMIRADRSRLQQLLENLLRNAVEHGGADVTVTIGELESGFYIEDDGPGIPEEDRDDAFEAGYSTSSEGTGFGLRIVKQVVDAHRWEVSVSEGERGGARFEITGVEFADR